MVKDLEIVRLKAEGVTNENKFEECWDDKPRETYVDTIVIHSMWNRDGKEGTQYSAEACMLALIAYQGLSTHYFIEKDGVTYQTVFEGHRAWHAGPPSKMPDPDNREGGANMFSIGVELIANETEGFTFEQYEALVLLILQVMGRHEIENIVGHSDISGPEVRKPPLEAKTDPWNFDWPKFLKMLEEAIGKKRYRKFKILKDGPNPANPLTSRASNSMA